MSEPTEIAELATAIADYEAFERFRSGRAALPSAQSRLVRLAVMLRGELANASALIAAAASLMNAIERGSTGSAAARALSVFVPPPSASVRKGIDALFTENVDLDVHECLLTYGARLTLAQRLSATFAAAAHDPTANPHIDAEILGDAWRRTCAAAADAIDALTRLIGDGTAPAGSNRTHVILLLRQAQDGGMPCIEADGRVTVPGWAERRREERRGLMLDATATIGDATLPIIIRDASESGLGIELDHDALPGDRVVIQLNGGRTLVGDIVWCDGLRAGVRLDRRLSPRDPVLARATSRPPRIRTTT